LIENRTELSKIYNRADLSLLPSLFDSVSLTLFEAACFKVPTVTVKDASIAKRLQSNNGFVLPNDPESYASGLHHIMSDQQKLNRVRENTYNTLYIT
jgi:glycosyltransferase involved in cell wall biosynthesis